MRTVIERILNESVWAPSGDNAQPWKFRVQGSVIEILNVPEKDTSFYNYNQSSNQVALGALAENIRVLARAAGFAPAITILPVSAPDATIRIKLQPGIPQDEGLASVVARRTSNRRPYDAKPIENTVLEQLNLIEGDASAHFVTDRNTIASIAKAVSVNEAVVLEDRKLHEYLFQHVTWNAKDDAQRHGFFIDTFEFNTMQRLAFRIFSSWRIMSLANTLGAARAIANDTEKTYRRSAAYGAIMVPADMPTHRISAGMLVQRIWLRTTEAGIAMQMTAGIPFLHRAATGLSHVHRMLVNNSMHVLKEGFSAQRSSIVCVFRIGYAEAPSGRTSRFAPVVEYV